MSSKLNKFLVILFSSLLSIVLIIFFYYLYLSNFADKNNKDYSCPTCKTNWKSQLNDPLLGIEQRQYIENTILPAYSNIAKNNNQRLYLVNEFTAVIGDMQSAKTSTGAEAILFTIIDEKGNQLLSFKTGIENFSKKLIKLYKITNNNKIDIPINELKKNQKIYYKLQEDLLDRTQSITEITVYD